MVKDQAFLDGLNELHMMFDGKKPYSLKRAEFIVEWAYEYKRSTNNNVRININAMGNINQRSCGIAHEFGHVILFLKGQPHSHSNNADYIYGRQWNVMRRLGYDYLESPTGTVFR
jgi:hypothetical protein